MFIVFAFSLIVLSSLKFKFWLTKPVRRRVPMVPWEPIEASAMREVSDQSSGCSRGKDDGVGEVGCNGSISTGDTRFGGIYEHSMISLNISSNSFQIKITDKIVIRPLLRYSIYFLKGIIGWRVFKKCSLNLHNSSQLLNIKVRISWVATRWQTVIEHLSAIVVHLCR